MDIILFVYGWFYYSFLYMALSAFATVMLNRAAKRLWLSPLIINGVSITILLIMVYASLITTEDASYAMYFIYMPIVFSSIMVNLVIYIIRNIKAKKEIRYKNRRSS